MTRVRADRATGGRTACEEGSGWRRVSRRSLAVAAGLFPPLDAPGKFTTPLLLLATAYRSVYGVAGGYLTARLEPDRPMGHALVLGALGLVACTAGTVAMWGVGPNWYPLALLVLAMPCAWAGGKLRVMQLSSASK